MRRRTLGVERLADPQEPEQRSARPPATMKGLDTNVLVRYLTQDEPSQAKKANVLITSAVGKPDRLHLDRVVLCEVVWVLRGAYGFDKQTVAGTLEKILSAPQFSIEDRDLLGDALADTAREGGTLQTTSSVPETGGLAAA
jgi:predicted nucleic-acid-binding protein